MANEPYNVSIETKAQLDEIQKLLAELRAINAEISKINGQTFSSVSSSAAELSQTSKDLANAIQSQRSSFDDLKKSTTNSANGLKEIQTESDNTKKKVDALSDTTTGFYMELGAMASRLATKLPNAVSACIRAFGEEEVALQKLTTAVRENGGNVAELMPIMTELAAKMQAITTFGDDQILSMQGLATSMGVSASQMTTVVQSAIGLSAALGMDLQTATKAASAAIQGKTELLTRYIPTLSMCKTEEEKLAKVQQLSSSGFEQAKSAADTLDGKLRQAANAWGDLQEVVGGTFAPTIKSVAGLIKGICEVMTENSVITKILTSAVAGLAVSFAFSKVGGLINVSKMILGVANSTKTATLAMHGLNAATKANPIGLIAGIAATAVVSLMSLCDYLSQETEEEKAAQAAIDAKRIAREKEIESTKAASGVLEQYNKKLIEENESASDAAKRISSLCSEIERLEGQYKILNGKEKLNVANELVAKKEELAAAQKKYVDLLKSAAENDFEKQSHSLSVRKYQVENDLNKVRETGLKHEVKFKEDELKYIDLQEKSLELQKKYYTDHAHLVESEADRIKIMNDAEKYAQEQVGILKERADAEKWLNSNVLAAKESQKNLELKILQARAGGNEVLAKDLEANLKIAQITDEIFENTRKEGMSSEQLIAAKSAANQKARERYELEKSVTDEVERQNLAKNAQAKIEDILITNKIEQLKAEGKLAEAKELENEREIKRALAGLQTVSDKEKENLANTMRRTNKYKEAQNNKQKESPQSAGNSQAIAGSGASSDSKARPATVSKKSAPIYDQWKASGGESGTGKSWNDYREQTQAQANMQDGKNPAAMQSSARGFLQSASDTARIVANSAIPMPAGAIEDAKNSTPQAQSVRSPKPPTPPTGQKAAASSAINNKLEAMGASNDDKKNSGSDELKSSVNTIKETLNSIKSTVSALAEKKK